ncbi:hypothetical protein, partial [Bacteroides xylanisolvens]
RTFCMYNLCFICETKKLYLYSIYETISDMGKEWIRLIIDENQGIVKEITFILRQKYEYAKL